MYEKKNVYQNGVYVFMHTVQYKNNDTDGTVYNIMKACMCLTSCFKFHFYKDTSEHLQNACVTFKILDLLY